MKILRTLTAIALLVLASSPALATDPCQLWGQVTDAYSGRLVVCGNQGQTTYLAWVKARWWLNDDEGSAQEFTVIHDAFPCSVDAYFQEIPGYTNIPSPMHQYYTLSIGYYVGNIVNPANWTVVQSQTVNACWQSSSPMIMSLVPGQDTLQLTSVANGVNFALTGNARQWSWTQANEPAAFLYMDRNSNGQVDGGTELFGDQTEQDVPAYAGEPASGYRALRKLDYIADNYIDALDPDYSRVGLWTDLNHNGVAESNEKQTLAQAGVCRVGLVYNEAGRKDQHGNQYRFTATAVMCNGSQRRTWDVFLRTQ